MSAEPPRKLKIDVTSDYLCPFCLLGMKQLEIAIDKYRARDPSLEFDIRMHPFQLNGVLTETPVSRREWGECKFGAERWKAVSAAVAAKFRAVGIEPAAGGSMSSSHLAHRLTEHAGTVSAETQLALSMDLFTLYHVDGTHLSDKLGLAGVAVKHKLFPDVPTAVQWLDSKAADVDVKKAYQRAQRNGITGVPFFVFQDKYAASGAMGVDEFVDIIGEVTKRESSHSPPPMVTGGDKCTVHHEAHTENQCPIQAMCHKQKQQPIEA